MIFFYVRAFPRIYTPPCPSGPPPIFGDLRSPRPRPGATPLDPNFKFKLPSWGFLRGNAP